MLSTEFSQQLEDEQPPLLVTLISDLGKLPKGIRYLFPRDLAIRLIHQKYALPVSNFLAPADLVVDEDQLQYTGLPACSIALETGMDTALAVA